MRLGAKKALLNRGTVIALSAILSAVFLISPVLALSSNNSPNGVLISPVVEETIIEKGQSLQIPMAVQNPTNSRLTLKAFVNDFLASSNESGTPNILLNNSKTPLPLDNFETLVEPIPNITLNPQQRIYFNVTLNVPTTALSGGYYGVIRFENANLANTANVGLTASAGTLFLITVPGNLTYKLSLTKFDIEQNNHSTSFVTAGKLSVVTLLDNVGNIHVQPFGTIEVKNIFGKIISTLQFNGNSPKSNILPDSIRKFTNVLPNKHWLGHYSVTASIAWQQGSSNIIIAKAGFWYLPVWFIITVIAVIVVIGLVIWLIVHRHLVKRRKYRH
jgi:hypothetical protein